ncbi:MAG: glycosyltransferase [Leptolyngbya sp.]|nr:glycosyltransferase [Candidatus Melainabacteria bacterium]
MQKNNSPRITIVTPTFNRAGLLPETIESVLGQSYPNFEYIIVDDGSTDNTKEVVSKYGDEIKYIYQDNQGEPGAVNTAWRVAKGEYFAVVSSDDPMKSNWLSVALEFMDNNPDALVGYPDWILIDKESKPIQHIECFEYRHEDMVSWLHCFPGPGTIIRKSAIPNVNELRNTSYRFMSDMVTWLDLSLLGKFARIPNELATWRAHEESISIKCIGLDRAHETLRMHREFFAKNLPPHIAMLERKSLSRAFHLCSVIIAQKHPRWSKYYRLRSNLTGVDDVDMPTQLKKPAFSIGALFRSGNAAAV